MYDLVLQAHLRLPANLPALEVKVSLGRLKPGPRSLLRGPIGAAQLLRPVEGAVVEAVAGLECVQVPQVRDDPGFERVQFLHLVGAGGVGLAAIQ